MLGSTYGGDGLVYGGPGLAVILTAGTFGTINASPWFNASIAILFIVLGLAMFDVVTIDFSRFSSGLQAPTRRGTFAVAFTMGAVGTLLAAACGRRWSSRSSCFRTVCTQAERLSRSRCRSSWPGDGPSMADRRRRPCRAAEARTLDGARQTGIWRLILGTAIDYGYLAFTLFANRWVDASLVSGSVQEKLEAGWTDSLAAGLERATSEGKPVLIDFWATWCKTA